MLLLVAFGYCLRSADLGQCIVKSLGPLSPSETVRPQLVLRTSPSISFLQGFQKILRSGPRSCCARVSRQCPSSGEHPLGMCQASSLPDRTLGASSACIMTALPHRRTGNPTCGRLAQLQEGPQLRCSSGFSRRTGQSGLGAKQLEGPRSCKVPATGSGSADKWGRYLGSGFLTSAGPREPIFPTTTCLTGIRNSQDIRRQQQGDLEGTAFHTRLTESICTCPSHQRIKRFSE